MVRARIGDSEYVDGKKKSKVSGHGDLNRARGVEVDGELGDDGVLGDLIQDELVALVVDENAEDTLMRKELGAENNTEEVKLQMRKE